MDKLTKYQKGNYINANGVDSIVVDEIDGYVKVDFLPGLKKPEFAMAIMGKGTPSPGEEFPFYRTIEPILITPSWLLSLGFTGRDVDEGKWEFTIEVSGTIAFVNCWGAGDIRYQLLGHDGHDVQFVHDLQNLFAQETGTFLKIVE